MQRLYSDGRIVNGYCDSINGKLREIICIEQKVHISNVHNDSSLFLASKFQQESACFYTRHNNSWSISRPKGYNHLAPRAEG